MLKTSWWLKPVTVFNHTRTVVTIKRPTQNKEATFYLLSTCNAMSPFSPLFCQTLCCVHVSKISKLAKIILFYSGAMAILFYLFISCLLCLSFLSVYLSFLCACLSVVPKWNFFFTLVYFYIWQIYKKNVRSWLDS